MQCFSFLVFKFSLANCDLKLLRLSITKSPIFTLEIKQHISKIYYIILFIFSINPIPIQANTSPIYQFFPLTSLNTVISLQNFVTFTLNSFSTLLLKVKTMPSTNSKFMTLNHDLPSGNVFQQDNNKYEVMITSLTEILELPNFIHIRISTIQSELRKEIFLAM